MPGPAEELVYRGVLLGVLDDALGRPLRVLEVRWGFGALLTTWAFFLGHTLAIDSAWRLTLDWGPALDFALFGVAMCWLRYRFDSCWPSAVAHNVGNVATPLLAQVL
jgi:membrane protease YdiL (CAAX protease family)